LASKKVTMTNQELKPDIGMNKEDMLIAVLASGDLPTIPLVASKLIALTSNEDISLSDVAKLVSQDVALSTKILKITNSALYSFPQQVSSIQQAVSMLGSKAVESLVLSFSFLTMNKNESGNPFDFDKFWERSFASAIASKLILQKIPELDAEEVFVSGLLQNLGELILACTFPKEFAQVTEESSLDLREAEISIFGADHCFVGYEVAKHWNFPPSVIEPVLHHHNPEGYTGDDPKVAATIRAIYLSGLLLNIFYSDKPEEYHRQFRTEGKNMLGLKSVDIEDILKDVHIELEQGVIGFGLKFEETKPVQDILQEANIRLSLLNLDYEQMNNQLIEAKVSLENLAKELQEKNALLKDLSNLDGLTGIYNNRFFRELLDIELSRTKRQNYNLSLILVDIDHFKKFNDNYGHLAGDFVLSEFSKNMTANLRKYDTLARYSGEEFVVFLPETDEEGALVVAEKLRASVENALFKEGEKEYNVTASFGISTLTSDSEEDIGESELIMRADEALHNAKKKGRNRVVVSAPNKGWFKKK